jgi:hypothetical protein
MSTTQLPLELQTGKQVGWSATIALVGAVSFTLLLIALHILRPELDPIRYPASRYAVGPYWYLMTLAFFSISTASWALLIGLYRDLSQPARSWTGLGFVGAWAAGVLVAMIFPMDVEGAPKTLAGTIHDISGPVAFLGMSLGTTLISRRWKHDERWRPFWRAGWILSLVVWAGYIATFASFVLQAGVLGLVQRITLLAMVAWMLLAAARLMRR